MIVSVVCLLGLLRTISGSSDGISVNGNEISFPILKNETVIRNGRLLIDEIVLPFAAKALGIIECTGFDHVTHIHIFESIYGPGVDFGGNYLCEPTCGGQCVPKNNDLLDAPISLYYPFGCRCPAARCNAHGPIVTPIVRPFKVTCLRDTRCTCTSMGPKGSHIGYLCNWINIETGKPITVLNRPLVSGYNPTYSPIRWCSCCPAQ